MQCTPSALWKLKTKKRLETEDIKRRREEDRLQIGDEFEFLNWQELITVAGGGGIKNLSRRDEIRRQWLKEDIGWL